MKNYQTDLYKKCVAYRKAKFAYDEQYAKMNADGVYNSRYDNKKMHRLTIELQRACAFLDKEVKLFAMHSAEVYNYQVLSVDV